MAESPQNVVLIVQDGVATITLNRPSRLNVIDEPTAGSLLDRAREIASRDDVRVVIIKGAGAGFCGGGDIEFMAAGLDDPAPGVTRLLTSFHLFLQLLRSLPAIVVTSVHGAAAGGGLSLAFMGDLCIAADTARFTPAYAQLGVSPDAGGTVGVVAAVGVRRAMQIFLMERSFTASQAEAWGLVNKVVPEADLEIETLALARRLAVLNPAAVAGTKRLLISSPGTALETQLDHEMHALIACMRTAPFKHAVTRFVGKSR